MAERGLPVAEVEAFIAMPKFLSGAIRWVERPTNSNFLQASFNVLNQAEETIPGLTVELLYRNDSLNRCKYLYTLFAFYEGRKLRAYQVEVKPPEQTSHLENGVWWYGPHQHFGEAAAKFEVEYGLGCAHFEEWFKIFLQNANVVYGGPLSAPPIQQSLL